ncbi:hypothetical protein L1987_21052 [Smallanthus sonchifolius]|uniref:Uncharacterized protein n=1 Tax=Smallanthus sonchifolius TaxID=185202 RepID=A0ACB9IV11_9ASTR|nr:hypothetical protein L1987_21052 [Smallanthus sonchifolius]
MMEPIIYQIDLWYYKLEEACNIFHAVGQGCNLVPFRRKVVCIIRDACGNSLYCDQLHLFEQTLKWYECRPYFLLNLAELGIKEPTPIQMQAIPILLYGKECFACAQTGSEKT